MLVINNGKRETKKKEFRYLTRKSLEQSSKMMTTIQEADIPKQTNMKEMSAKETLEEQENTRDKNLRHKFKERNVCVVSVVKILLHQNSKVERHYLTLKS